MSCSYVRAFIWSPRCWKLAHVTPIIGLRLNTRPLKACHKRMRTQSTPKCMPVLAQYPQSTISVGPSCNSIPPPSPPNSWGSSNSEIRHPEQTNDTEGLGRLWGLLAKGMVWIRTRVFRAPNFKYTLFKVFQTLARL